MQDGEKRALEASKIEHENLKKYGAFSGRCNLCSTSMTYEEFATHKCSKASDGSADMQLLTWSPNALPGKSPDSNAVLTANESGGRPKAKVRPSRLEAIGEGDASPTMPKTVTIDDINFDNVMRVGDDGIRQEFINRTTSRRGIALESSEYFVEADILFNP